jgi:hypothetical protein
MSIKCYSNLSLEHPRNMSLVSCSVAIVSLIIDVDLAGKGAMNN